MAGELDRGRECFRSKAWAAAFAHLSGADRASPLAPADLQLLATAAYLVGNEHDGDRLLARAYRESLAAGDRTAAARSAFWLAFHLLHAGNSAQAGGWLGRARSLLDDAEHRCVEDGYLLVPAAVENYFAGDYPAAHALSSEAAEIGRRFGDLDLQTLAQHVQARALIGQGRSREAMALLDEAMVAILADEVSAVVAGDTYCGVLEACQEVFDLARAREWTASLSRWCAAQPDLVLFRGHCLVHRAEIMVLSGEWPDALDEARQACQRLSEPPGQPAAGAAFYQLGELHRLGGAFEAAEDAYRGASRWGHQPQPGLALLRLAQGQVDVAAAASRRLVGEAGGRLHRSRLIPAHIEIMLAAGDVQAARLAADELSATADDVGSPMLRAAAAQAGGAVLLGEGDGRGAEQQLRRAWTAWHDLGAPYEAARTRVLLGQACGMLGDDDGAIMELDAARWTFERLGAVHDVAVTETLSRKASAAPPARLTEREMQVLRLVASGKTNRAIAADLFLSEKTVARHLSNIYTKLGLSSRSAATAYAYENGLT
ncbi:MAG TPA: LuxR C-terminal-related transcriptional regulator [Asanoa sp.]|nr:LuxR C-terminal-related transcriptional regulator [Asanoa sp.]